jgi:hypothetical protein
MSDISTETYTDELGVLGKKKTTLQAHGVIVPPELQDKL